MGIFLRGRVHAFSLFLMLNFFACLKPTDHGHKARQAVSINASHASSFTLPRTMDASTILSPSPNDFLWPACAKVSYNPLRDLDHPEPMAWRNEAIAIKIQLLQEIHTQGLSLNRAVALALINNPELMAFYENLSAGHADFLEAGLRNNPAIEKGIAFPHNTDEDDAKPQLMFEQMYNFLDFFLIPLKEQAAWAELEVIKTQFEQTMLDVVMQVEINWLEVKMLVLELNQQKQRTKLKELAFKLAEEQRRVGNVSNLTVRALEIDFLVVDQELKDDQFVAAIEKMNRSLGLFGDEACWKIAGDIDWRELDQIPDLYQLEVAAIANRPDIETARREIIALAELAKLKEPWTYANIMVGSSIEGEPAGSFEAGPKIYFEQPIFNYGQAQAQKSLALIAQAQKELLGKIVDACSEIRELVGIALTLKSQLEDSEQKIFPNFVKEIADAMAHYNVMSLSIYDVFAIKNNEIEEKIEYITALKNYLIARVKLLHALGGSLTSFRGEQ